MTKKVYDYIIIGGGLSGLMLADQLMNSEVLSHKQVLILDREDKNSNDRTWSFWSKPEFYHPLMRHSSWTHFDVYIGEERFSQHFSPYSYYSIQSADFYAYVHGRIAEHSNMELIQDEMLSVDEEDGVVHLASGQSIHAQIIFNSAYDIKSLTIDPPFINLWQHFKGWLIKTDDVKFDTNTATLMDFRTEQYKDVRFFYILPYSEDKALVEYTGFSPFTLEQEVYDQKLRDYIRHTLDIKDYTIEESEYGVIPMTDYPFIINASGKVVPIGTMGGYVKASTGYSFTRVVKRTRELVALLARNPDKVSSVSSLRSGFRFRMYDTIFLEVMQSNMHSMDRIFYDLYAHKRPNLVFKFLDEETSLPEEISIMSACPFDFYKAMLRRLKVMKQI